MSVHRLPVTGPPGVDLAEESRRLYEQIGALYLLLEEADAFVTARTGQRGDGDGTGVQEFANFLDTVRRVADAGRHADHTDRSLALYHATRRYEADRTGGRG